MHPKKPNGFSLLSMLAAIAIVGILVCLVFTAANWSRDQATLAACFNNLRQIGTALHLYLGDHNGRYPPNRANPAYQTRDNPAGIHWQEALKVYLKPYPKGVTVTGEMAGPLWCRADLARRDTLADHSYGVNAFIGGAEAAEKQNIRMEPHPSRRLYLIEGTRQSLSTCNFSHQTWPFNGSVGPPNTEVRVDFRHRGRANGLFLDGRVETFQVSDLRGVNPTQPLP